ncbi:substrate-binding protein [Motiliproteus sp.]|uniref:substrate-binding protein n=1 Tax=Motiliproteus sp. TaxID=1898955 RepID=UPI003BAB235F
MMAALPVVRRWPVVMLLVFWLAGCGQSQTSEPIRLGVVLPLSGVFQTYGQLGLNGATLAVEQINAAGGVLGRPLQLVVRDNRTQPAESVRLTRELIQIDDVFALIGPVSSAARRAMQEVAAQYQIPQFYGIDYEGGQFSRYLVCYSTIPEHYVDPLIPYLQQQSDNSFYIFGYDYVWPHQMSRRISADVARLNGRIAGVEFTPFGVTDFSPVLQRIKASGAQNLMLILPGADGFNFIRQMHRFDFGRTLNTVAFAADETYLDALEPEQSQGLLSALHFFSDSDSPRVRDFVDDYQRRFGGQSLPTYSSRAHYGQIYLIKRALEQAGRVDREAMLDALPGLTPYQGQPGLKLRADHHFDLPMYLGRFEKGQLRVIEELGTISPADQRL